MPDPEVKAAPEGTQGEPKKQEGGQPITASWRESFDDADLKGATTLDKFKGKDERELLAAVAKGYVNLEKMPRGVVQPKEGAPQAEWDAFYEKLGRPKTADEYGLELKVPEGVPWNKGAEKLMLQAAHEAGLSKTQADKLMNKYLGIAAEGQLKIKQDVARTAEAAYGEISKEWGGMTERNLALVQRHVTEFGGSPLKEYLDETGLGNDPRFLRYALAAAQPMLEGNMIRGEGLGMKKAEAAAEIARLMATPEWAKGDKATLARIQDLYPIANS